VGWGLRGRAKRALERILDAVVPEAAAIAFLAMRRHKRNVGVYPNLIRPKTFNEKILNRMVFDRRPILTRLQDKYAAREYVRERIGNEVLPDLYWVTKNPANIPFDKLPDRFVVKATHGCGFNYLVPDKASLDREDLLARCGSWLRWNYYHGGTREWAYKHIEPRIIVEELISDGTGPDPIRYKLYAFHGKVRVIYVGIGPPGRADCSFYEPSWNRRSATVARKKEIEGDLDRPGHLDDMIRYAQVLADGLDFIRVDLYDTQVKVYFSEFTIYPGAGTAPYSPHEFDSYLGRFWRR
jgi:hypothetical protein